MHQKKKLLIAMIVIVVAGLTLHIFMKDRNTTQGHSASGHNTKSDFVLPAYVDIEAPDTYRGLVDVTGVWVNTRAPRDVIEFSADGSYHSTSSFGLTGKYEVCEGYLAIFSDLDTYDALRMVDSGEVDIFLQMDDETLPYTYRRLRSDENLDQMQSEWSGDDDVLRHYVSAFKQILQKSKWVSMTTGVDGIVIDSNTIKLYEGTRVAAEWRYSLSAPESIDSIPQEPPYFLKGCIDGVEYIIQLESGPYYEYDDGFSLKIYNDGNTLLVGKSREKIIVEEP